MQQSLYYLELLLSVSNYSIGYHILGNFVVKIFLLVPRKLRMWIFFYNQKKDDHVGSEAGSAALPEICWSSESISNIIS